jgi:hypothetical protein
MHIIGSTLERSSLHYATTRKGVGLIPYFIGFFSCPKASSCSMALVSTQPLAEMSTRNIPGGVKERPAPNLSRLPK